MANYFRRLNVLALVCASVAWAQADSNSIIVTASRIVSVQPDQAVLSVTVETALTAGPDDVFAAVAGAGITANQLINVSSSSNALDWTFQVTIPLENVQSTISALDQLQRMLRQNNSGPQLYYSNSGTRTSPDAQAAAPCPFAELVADARKQAQQLASGAGLFLGPIVGVAQGYGAVPQLLPSPAIATPAFVFLSGTFSGGLSGALAYIGAAVAPNSCALTVKFTLLH